MTQPSRRLFPTCRSFVPDRCLAALLLCTAASGLGGSVSSAATSHDYGDITRPEFFPILPWDPYHGWQSQTGDRAQNGLASLASCHFNMAGFVLPRDLRQCEKLGLGAILLPTEHSFTNFEYFRQWKALSSQEIEERVRQMVRQGGHSRAIKGYFITDEPGVSEFPALAKAVAAVKKFAPGKLAYINLFPDYATLGAPDRSQLGTTNYAEYLERFISEVQPQVLSYDNYMVEYSDDLEKADKAADYYRNLLEVRRVALKHGLPYLNIVCANEIRTNAPPPSPANLLFQAYTTLAAGYRGVTWYNYYGPGYRYTAITPQGGRSLTWSYLQAINAQVAQLAPTMSRLRSTGVFFTSPPAEGLPALPGKLVASAECSTPLMVGEFTDGKDEEWVMFVNLSLKASVKFSFRLVSSGRPVELVSAADGTRSPVDPAAGYWLAAGQGILLCLTR